MYYDIWNIADLFIGVPAIIGLIRWRRIEQAYYPIIILVILGFINVTLNIILISKGYYNLVNTGVYSLIEPLLLTWQFYNWRALKTNRKGFFLLGLFFIAGWVIDGLVINNFSEKFTSYFIICYSFITVLLSVNVINHLIVQSQLNIIKNSTFLICMALIIFCTYAVITEIFWLYGFTAISDFNRNINIILRFISLLVNIIFVFAFLWIPRKQKFLMQSS